MQYLVKENPIHVRHLNGERIIGEIPAYRDNAKYHYGLEIPHQLNAAPGEMRIIFPADSSLELGDIVMNEWGKEMIVTEILERRPARGNWKCNPFDSSPDFIHIRIV